MKSLNVSMAAVELDSGQRLSTPNQEQTKQRANLAILIGILLITLGLSLSATLLEATILPTGTLVGTTRRGPALVVCRILLVLLGAGFVVRRPRITVVH